MFCLLFVPSPCAPRDPSSGLTSARCGGFLATNERAPAHAPTPRLMCNPSGPRLFAIIPIAGGHGWVGPEPAQAGRRGVGGRHADRRDGQDGAERDAADDRPEIGPTVPRPIGADERGPA